MATRWDKKMADRQTPKSEDEVTLGESERYFGGRKNGT